MIPRKLKNMNLFVDGQGYAGKVESLTLPKLSRTMEEWRGGGMQAPIECDMGMEKLEATFVVAEYAEDLFRLWGLTDSAAVNLRMKGVLEADDADGGVTPVEAVLRGRWRELDLGDWKAGEAATMTVAIALTYYNYISNGENLIEIDVPNMVEKVGGVDRLAEHRAALGF